MVDRGSSPTHRNWKCVPVGMERLTRFQRDHFLAAVLLAPHFTSAGQDVPDLLDRSVRDGTGHVARRELEVCHAAPVQTEEQADVGSVGGDGIPLEGKPLGCERGHRFDDLRRRKN
jgi:hypothetical protein